MAKKMKLFEWAMAGRKGCVSPYVWRIKMLLAHFGLDYESEMFFGVEMKEALAFAQGEAERLGTKAPYAPNGTVPVLVDGETILPDSWTIAAYLDERYGGGKVVNANPALNRFFEGWVGQPIYADYIVFGTFYWLSKVSTTEVLNPDSAVHRWRERLMDANGGLARQN
jgi:glutathione S-transferase